jgi:sensor histidine kinase YesM
VALIYDVPFGEIDQAKNLQRNMGLGLLAGSILYIYQLQRNNYQLKLNEKELQVAKLNELKTNAELKTLQARINPHFLYNSLNSITSLIHDDPAKAEEMTLKLSKLFRYSINTQESNWTTVKEELNIVDTYLDIEKVRFGNRIEFITQADDSIQNEMIPRFLLQPLVENALKHGLNNKSSGGILKVTIRDQRDSLLISVHDNGPAFPSDLLAGYGLQGTHDKMNLLYGADWKMDFVNAPEKQISIVIPKQKPA